MEQILINKYINQSVHYVNFFSVTLFYWLRSTALYAELSYNTTGQFRLFLDWNQSFCWTWCSFSVLMQSDYLKKPYVKYYKVETHCLFVIFNIWLLMFIHQFICINFWVRLWESLKKWREKMYKEFDLLFFPSTFMM